MHSSNGDGYTLIIISYGLSVEPKNDKVFIRLSQAVFIKLFLWSLGEITLSSKRPLEILSVLELEKGRKWGRKEMSLGFIVEKADL